jgi:WD40 repeat protein
LAISPDGSQLATAGDGQQIRIWDLQTGTEILTLPRRLGRVHALVYCGDGRLASGGSDNVIRLWDLTGKNEQLRLVGHTGSVAALDMHLESGILVSVSFDTTVRLWDLKRAAAGNIPREARKIP